MSALPETRPLPADVIRMYVGAKKTQFVQAAIVQGNQEARKIRLGSAGQASALALESPYATPLAGSSKRADRKLIKALFSSNQVGLGTFLGGPLVAGMLLTSNYIATKSFGKAIGTVVISVLAMVGLLVLAFAGPSLPSGVGSLVGLGIALIAKKVNQAEFKDLLDLQKGSDRRKSNWLVTGACAIAISITVAAVFSAIRFGL